MFGFKIKFRSPVVIMPLWRYEAIKEAKAGRSISAVKIIRDGRNSTLREAKEYYDKHIKNAHYRQP